MNLAPSLRAALAIWAAGCALAGTSDAARWVRQDRVTLHADETWNEEVIIGAGEADIAGTVRGDLFLAGYTARISGPLEGDAWICASRRMDWDGAASDDVRLVSPLILFRGSAARRAYLSGGTIKVESSARLGRETDIVAEDVIFQGETDGPLNIRARRVTLGGHMRGPVRVDADDIVIQSGTVIEGYLRYSAPSILAVPADARVTGEVIRDPAPPRAGIGGMWIVYLLAAFWLMNTVFALVLPGPLSRAADLLRREPTRCALTGLVVMTITPFVAGLLGATMVGVPLVLALLFGVLLAFSLSPAVTAAALGARFGVGRGASVRRKLMNQAGVGLLALLAVALLPYIGLTLLLLAAAAGAGALLRSPMREPRTLPPPLPEQGAS
ncbi:MAG: polymer-forming cytoskeletal protein [Kiritimatiellae bacterium]|nr:polymer-forming cytoskeletal protein [Kiritimatiellia bacterium]